MNKLKKGENLGQFPELEHEWETCKTLRLPQNKYRPGEIEYSSIRFTRPRTHWIGLEEEEIFKRKKRKTNVEKSFLIETANCLI